MRARLQRRGYLRHREDLATGQVVVALRAWSRPDTWLARLTAPIARKLQLRGSEAALDHLQSLVRPDTTPT